MNQMCAKRLVAKGASQGSSAQASRPARKSAKMNAASKKSCVPKWTARDARDIDSGAALQLTESRGACAPRWPWAAPLFLLQYRLYTE